jgi:iron complex outermembrane receptor protein
LASSPAWAQESAPPSGDMQIEEIVVTAQKREENLQSVPIAVSAFGHETLERIGANRAGDIGRLVPNLSATATPSSTSTIAYSIRGIGQVEPLMTVDPGVGIYVDGVYVARQTGGAFQLADIERIEVLRGPQGTLYGRNTTGGAISVITKAPSGKFDLKQTVSYGNYDSWRSMTTLNLPSFGPLSIKASYLHSQNGGYVRQKFVPGVNYAVNSFGDENVDAVAIAARLDISDRLKVDYRFDYSDSVGVPLAQQLVAASPTFQGLLNASIAAGGTGDISPGRLSAISADTAGLDKNRSHGHSVTASWDVSDAISIKSISAWRGFKNRLDGSDLDGNTLRLGNPPAFYTTFAGMNDRRQRQFSQELQFLANGAWGNFIGGLYYFSESGDEFNQQFIPDPGNGRGGTAIPGSPGPGAIVNVPLDYSFGAKSYAAFAQATAHVTDRFDITAGGRYTEDKRNIVRRLYGNFIVIPTPLTSFARDATYRRFNWTVTADYAFTNNIHAYARVATAYKSGGFSPRASNPDFYAFAPEDLMSYELGLKSELFDRRVRLNLAMFQNDYDDLQVNQFEGIGGATSRTLNAGKARFRGFEADLTARLTPELTFTGGLGLLDAAYKTFSYRDPVTGIVSDVASLAKFTNAPATTANAALDYAAPLGALKLLARIDASYRSRIYVTPVTRLDDAGAVQGYWLVNGRVGLGDIAVAGGNVEVAVWARNLLDKEYRGYAVEFANSYAISTFGVPRTYGVEATFRF